MIVDWNNRHQAFVLQSTIINRQSSIINHQSPMDTLIKDLRYAVRNLGKRPAFTLVVVLTLALGIGSNTTVFSLANSVFLRQLPVAAPQNLVWIFSNGENPSSYPEYLDYQQQTELFDGVLAYDWVGLNVGTNDHAERIEGA